MSLRTIHGFVKEAKIRDSSSAINETFIRKLVKGGLIPCIWSGNRAYIDIEKTFAALDEMITESTAKPVEVKNNTKKNFSCEPDIYSLNPVERANAKLQKIKIV